MPEIHLGPYAAVATVMTTELNAIAATTGKAISAAQDNSTDLALWADLELSVDFVSAPTANTVIELYLVPSIDGGTTYADGSSSIVPQAALYVGGFVVRNTTALQIMVIRSIVLPPGFYKWLIQNTTNQAFPATGSTLRMATYAMQSV
jgi:hypothetical protein